MKTFEDAVNYTGVSSEDREAWLKARRSGIGGSDAAAIMGLSPYTSALEVYASKVSSEPMPEDDSEYLVWGREFEGPILNQYARRTGRAVMRGGELLQSKRHPFLLVTLDASQQSDGAEWAAGPGVVEVKTTADASRWKDDVPMEVQVQVQHEMLVTGAVWATAVVLPFPQRKLAWQDVTPHTAFQATLLEACEEFWRRVERREPPLTDRSDSARRALAMLYPDVAEVAIMLEDGASWADAYSALGNDIKELEAQKQELANRLKQTAGPCRYVLTGDGRFWDRTSVPAKDKHCPHCAKVIGNVAAHTKIQLRQRRKKPLPAPVEARMLLEARSDLAAMLQASLTEGENEDHG